MVFGMCPRCAARNAELEHRFQLAKLEIEKEKRLLELRKQSEAKADIEIKTAPHPLETRVRINGAELRKLRGNETQENFAERCGVSVSTIYHGERGDKWYVTTLNSVAKRLEIAPAKLSHQ